MTATIAPTPCHHGLPSRRTVCRLGVAGCGGFDTDATFPSMTDVSDSSLAQTDCYVAFSRPNTATMAHYVGHLTRPSGRYRATVGPRATVLLYICLVQG